MRTVYTVAFSDGRFLMVYNPKRKGWEMPGGRIEDGESVADAAVREFEEESGYRIRVFREKEHAGCSVCAAVLGEKVSGGEFESKLFAELPDDLAFGRSEYDGVIEWARPAGKRCKLVVFDMDGVLVDHVSSWAWVHDRMNVNNEEAFRSFKEGKITETEFIRRDIGLWLDKDKNVRISDIVNALHDIPLISGIQETIAALSYNGIRSVIVSGGIDKAAQMIAEEYGFDGYAANSILAYPDGRLTGEGRVNVDLTDKGVVTREFMRRYGASREETVAVGNSYTDVKMLEAAGLAIAFNPIDEAVINAADRIIRSKNLSDILELILGTDDVR